MEFLSRLIGGVGATSTRKTTSNSPQNRLARFRKVYNHTLQVWHRLPPAAKADAVSIETLRTCLQRLTNLLHDDTRAPAPHLCLSFAASQQVYITITRICLSLNDEDIVREAVSWFSALVDNDEENMLADERFAEQLTAFAENISSLPGLQGSQTESEVMELMFGIVAKIRLEPSLLPVWFMSEEEAESIVDGSEKTGQSILLGDHKRFPLCYQFVTRVYNDGRSGDFARMGLTYIFESVSNSPELERWIIESDLFTLMASGLGALYSQLSRKLAIAHPRQNMPLVLALSDDALPTSQETEVDSFYSEDLQSQLATFMSNLVFWQDILDHCRSLEIKQTLIDHFQVFFLQQILYPSLLESSDIDGGSSVAVLTYLWRILDSLEHPDLTHLILRYLLAISDQLPIQPLSARSPAAEKRRESLLTLSQVDGGEDQLNPSFFNLTDLILASVQSRNSETLTAALRLITVLLMKHHAHSYSSLLRISTHKTTGVKRKFGSLQVDTGVLYQYATTFGGDAGLDEAYDNCLKDSLALVESHSCSASRLGVSIGDAGGGTKHRSAILEDESSSIQFHHLLPDDPLLASLMRLLAAFFANDVETNLGLTNVLTHLAACPFTNLEGWLVYDNSTPDDTTSVDVSQEEEAELVQKDDPAHDPKENENERIDAFKTASMRPKLRQGHNSAVTQVLEQLSRQMTLMRSTVPNLDYLIASRKRAFQGATELEDERRNTPAYDFSPRASTSASRNSSRSRLTQAETATRSSAPQDSPMVIARGRVIGGGRRNSRPDSPQPSSSRPIRIARPNSLSRSNARGLSSSPTKLARTMSPLVSVIAADEMGIDSASITSGSIEARAAEASILDRKLKFPLRTPRDTFVPKHDGEGDLAGTEAGYEESKEPQGYTQRDEGREVSLSHVLTNIVILQEFVLELMALIQIRSSLLKDEVQYQ